jgi:hypothetical protein
VTIYKPVLEHASKVTNFVHDELIRWVGGLLKDGGLESVDVWGRFPPEGTVRSHLVLFPYRVGPEPRILENSRGASLMTSETFPSDKVGKVPTPWRNLGKLMYEAVNLLYPDAGGIDTPARPSTLPFPRLADMPAPLRAWYEAQDRTLAESFVIEEDGELYARPPALGWRPGISVWAHYIAVAGDAGRGVTDRTSDAPPLSLAALAVITVGVQLERSVTVELPPMPYAAELRTWLDAAVESLAQSGDAERIALGEQIADARKALERTAEYSFAIIPHHDLTMHEFALLTQAMQRPLQAVLNFRIMFSLGDVPEFAPTSVVSMRYARNKR